MPDASAWESFAGVVAVLVFLGAGVVALRRMGLLGARPAASAPASTRAERKPLDQRVDEVEEELRAMRLLMAENYVRRDDYITNESRVIGLLESHSVMLARLEERIGARS